MSNNGNVDLHLYGTDPGHFQSMFIFCGEWNYHNVLVLYNFKGTL